MNMRLTGENASLCSNTEVVRRKSSPHSGYSCSVNLFLFSLVGPNRWSAVMVTSGQRRQHRRNAWPQSVTHWLKRDVSMVQECPAEHLCSATVGAQAQRNQTHGSMWTLTFSRTCHFRGKCKITPRNLQPFLSNTLLHSIDTALLQESSLNHSLLYKSLISSFLRWSVLTFSSPSPLMAFLMSLKTNASNSQQLEYICFWQELCSPPESRKNGAHFLEMKRIRKQRAWCWCDSVGLLCREEGGGERWCSYGEKGQVGSVYQCCHLRCLWRRNNKY